MMRLCLAFACSLAVQINAHAQPPTLNTPFPVGVQRGTTIELTLTGANLAEPTTVVTSFPAKVTIPTENNNGKDAAKFVAKLEVPKDAAVGWHTIRVLTKRGVSNLRLFCVDDLPQVLEQDTNRGYATAQLVPVPCVIAGRADAEITDYYKFVAAAGQRLSFEVLGRRLGSQLDPHVIVYHAPTKRQIAFSDDAPGQLKDPRFAHTFKEGGEYVLEIRDVRYQGGADWFYRIRIGDFPLATTLVPLAGKRGTTVEARFAGPLVEGVPPAKVQVPTDPTIDVVNVSPSWPSGGTPGWPVPFFLSDLDEAVETEPNDDPAKANRVNVPGAISARFEKKGEKDHFVFTAKKGQRLLIDALTQEMNSPSSVYMVLKDAKGAQVAASDPMKDPTRIDFNPQADGDFTLLVEHLLYWGGPAETYRLTVTPHEPGFSLSVAADHFDLPQGGPAIATVQVARRDYSGPIELSVATPGLKGTATIPANQNAGLLAITAEPNATLNAQRLVIAGKATINNKPVTEYASIRGVVAAALGNLPTTPQHLDGELAIGVVDKPPFTLEAKYDLPESLRNAAVPVTITATKAAGFDEEITITSLGVPPPQGQPPVVPPVTVKIPKGQTQVKAELKPAANAPLGQIPLAFIGKAKANSVEHSVATDLAPVVLSLPFELQVDTAGGKLMVGGKHKIKVKAVRKGGYKGPISLEVRNLPANVTAAKPTIAENQTEAEIELSTAADTPAGDKADVNVNGTATGAGNQQNASGNFTVSVVK